jgi:hypothetical protein
MVDLVIDRVLTFLVAWEHSRSFCGCVLIVVTSVHKSFAAMHLMYTLDESGNRIYTLNVSIFIVMERLLFDSLFQKTTDTGRITKSAHPGLSLLMPIFLAQECASLGILMLCCLYSTFLA